MLEGIGSRRRDIGVGGQIEDRIEALGGKVAGEADLKFGAAPLPAGASAQEIPTTGGVIKVFTYRPSLYTDGPLAHEFPRTVSRLREMQSAEFLALARRGVVSAVTGGGTAAGVVGFGRLYDYSQNYDIALVGAAVMLASAAFTYLLLPRIRLPD